MTLKTIRDLAKKHGARTFPLIWTCIGLSLLFIAGWALVAGTSLTYGADQFALDLIGLLVAILAGLLLMPVQLTLNDFWKREGHPRAHIRTSYTNGEKAWIVVGALLMFYQLVAAFVLPPPATNYNAGENYEDSYGTQEPLDLDTPSDQQEKPVGQPPAEEIPKS